MARATRENTLPASVTAKLKVDEKALIAKRAAERGVSVSEWARTVLVAAASGLEPQFGFLAAQMQASRAITLEVLKAIIPGSKEEKERALVAMLRNADNSSKVMSQERWKKFAAEMDGGAD